MKAKLVDTQKNLQLVQPAVKVSFFLAFIPHKCKNPV